MDDLDPVASQIPGEAHLLPECPVIAETVDPVLPDRQVAILDLLEIGSPAPEAGQVQVELRLVESPPEIHDVPLGAAHGEAVHEHQDPGSVAVARRGAARGPQATAGTGVPPSISPSHEPPAPSPRPPR